MANEVAGILRCELIAPPGAGVPVGLPANFPVAPSLTLPVGGIRLPEGVVTSIYHVFRVPAAVLLATGLTVEVVYALPWNPANADLRGTKVHLGATAGPLVSGTSTVDDTAIAGSTEVAVQSAVLPTVAGRVVIHPAIAIPLASLNALAAGATALFRLRRLGTNALDTYGGEINVINIDIRNT